MKTIKSILCILIIILKLQELRGSVLNNTYDVCVYAANASGVMAAVAAAREGASVVIIEPSRWLGGMTGSGLVNVDWGRQETVGGSARLILKHNYNDPQYRD